MINLALAALIGLIAIANEIVSIMAQRRSVAIYGLDPYQIKPKWGVRMARVLILALIAWGISCLMEKAILTKQALPQLESHSLVN